MLHIVNNMSCITHNMILAVVIIVEEFRFKGIVLIL
jgi:hypothetical protein